MNLLPYRCQLAIAAVVDIAIHARSAPVAAKSLARRHALPPRHLESLLQALVRADILKGVRGPRGGYELAKERRRIAAGEIVRTILADDRDNGASPADTPFIHAIILPIAESASAEFLRRLDGICIEELCQNAMDKEVFTSEDKAPDFTI